MHVCVNLFGCGEGSKCLGEWRGCEQACTSIGACTIECVGLRGSMGACELVRVFVSVCASLPGRGRVSGVVCEDVDRIIFVVVSEELYLSAWA